MAEGADSSPDIFNPSERTKPQVWAHFGYCKSADGKLIEDGYPVCRVISVTPTVTLQLRQVKCMMWGKIFGEEVLEACVTVNY